VEFDLKYKQKNKINKLNQCVNFNQNTGSDIAQVIFFFFNKEKQQQNKNYIKKNKNTLVFQDGGYQEWGSGEIIIV